MKPIHVLVAATLAAPSAFAVMERDPSYSGFPAAPQSQCSGFMKVLPDQGVLQTYYRLIGSDGSTVPGVVRRRADGSLDPNWGSSGVVELPFGPFEGFYPRHIASLADGGFLVVGQRVVKLLPGGAVDLAYGVGGRSSDTLGGLTELQSAAVLPDGGLVAMVRGGVSTSTVLFTRLGPDGVRDSSFGSGGYLEVPVAGAVYAWGVQADGQVQVATYPLEGAGSPRLQRYPNDFATSEGATGRLVPRDVVASWLSPGAKVDAAGRLVLAAASYGGTYDALPVLRFNADGTPDATFGDGGRRNVRGPFPGLNTLFSVRDVNLSADGSITVLANHTANVGFSLLDASLRAFRLAADGGVVADFGEGIRIGGQQDLAVQRDDGRYVVSRLESAGVDDYGCATDQRLNDQPRSAATLVEYEHRGRYFITAEGPEAALLDADTAVERLKRTGRAIGAWLPAAQLPGSLPLCRFNGDRSAGPIGHFYSLQGAECDAVRADDARLAPGTRTWRFEGLAFNEAPTSATGACPQNLQPVYRLYNNAATRGGDPNHRYTIDRSVISEMQSRGWTLEGAAFCAPPAAH